MRNPPDMPDDVAAAFDAFPVPVRERLLAVRQLIFEAADAVDAGPLSECLKWGEPAYLTEATKSGSTIRLGVPRERPDRCAVFLNCRTTLVDDCRTRFPEAFDYEGNRAILMPVTGDVPEGPLSMALTAALTYHRGKRKAG